jgi:hypothetical protein
MTPDKSHVLYGTVSLMVIRTLAAHAIARRVEQISRNQLARNHFVPGAAQAIVERFLKISEKPS